MDLDLLKLRLCGETDHNCNSSYFPHDWLSPIRFKMHAKLRIEE